MKLNKSISILILAVFLFSLLGFFVFAAERKLEVEYPKVGEEEITATTTLPEYIKYIFKFSLIIAAVAAFAILIYGGFRYLTSAGAPEIMRDAKSWIYGGILGLVLLLCSYLILTTINPELLSPKEPEIGPTTGIYLINDKDEKLYFIQDTPKITQEFETPPFNATFVSFISPSPLDQRYAEPDVAELHSIYVYSEKNYKGQSKKIENNGATEDLPFPPRSLRFLWHNPGIYLYDQPKGWKTDSWPLFLNSSVADLKSFMDKGNKSLRIVHRSFYDSYWLVLFDHVDYRGPCKLVWDDMDSYDKLKDKVSSVALLGFFHGEVYGEIIFYNEENCLAEHQYTWTPPPPEEEDYTGGYDFLFSAHKFDNTDILLENRVESFRINGNFSVLLNTKEDLSGNCQLFLQTGCTETLKGSSVYCWPWYKGRCRPKIALILTVTK